MDFDKFSNVGALVRDGERPVFSSPFSEIKNEKGEYTQSEDMDLPQEQEETAEIQSLLGCFSQDISYVNTAILMPYHKHTFKILREDLLCELADNISKFGVLEPILLWVNKDGRNEIVAGHNRVEASKIAGLQKVPCRYATAKMTELMADEIMVASNLNRRNSFTKMELARSLKVLYDSRKMQGQKTDTGKKTREDIADEFGLSCSKIVRYLRLAELNDFFAE